MVFKYFAHTAAEVKFISNMSLSPTGTNSLGMCIVSTSTKKLCGTMIQTQQEDSHFKLAETKQK